MGMITVLRLEDANGRGCFSAADMQDFTDAAVQAGLMTAYEDTFTHFHVASRGFPGPHGDYGLQEAAAWKDIKLYHSEYRYAFPSREVAQEWFPPCMADALNRIGQTLTLWEVPEEFVAASDRQCVFHRDLATLVERLPVSALHEPERQAQLFT